MSESAFGRSFFDNIMVQVFGLLYLMIGAGSCVVNGGLAIYHNIMGDLLQAPLHVVAWPVYWTFSVLQWEPASQMILLWIGCGIYAGLGIITFVQSFFWSVMGGRGNLLGITIVSLLRGVVWPFFFSIFK